MLEFSNFLQDVSALLVGGFKSVTSKTCMVTSKTCMVANGPFFCSKLKATVRLYIQLIIVSDALPET